MIELKIFIMFICAGLFFWGGFSWHNARRFIMPLVLAIAGWFISKDAWSLTMLSTSGFFCLGYGDKSPFRHIFGNGWGRGVWGLLASIGLSLGLFLTGHIYVYWMVLYLVSNFCLENFLKNLNQKIGDPLIGLGFSCVLLLIH